MNQKKGEELKNEKTISMLLHRVDIRIDIRTDGVRTDDYGLSNGQPDGGEDRPGSL
jgi:hypothetical protein